MNISNVDYQYVYQSPTIENILQLTFKVIKETATLSLSPRTEDATKFPDQLIDCEIQRRNPAVDWDSAVSAQPPIYLNCNDNNTNNNNSREEEE